MYVPPKPDPVPLTATAYAQFQAEFRELKQLRAEVMERLKVAREMGDLSENGAYKYAKFELGNIGRRMRDLRFLLENGVVTSSQGGDTIAFGSQVVLVQETSGKRLEFMLVSEYESDPAHGKLSTKSPVGQAVFGKRQGDHVSVELPTGKVVYHIESVT